MKKSIIAALLACAGTGYYLNQQKHQANVDQYINDIVNTTKTTPFRLGSSFGKGVYDTAIEWSADKKEGNLITGTLKEYYTNMISVPTKSLVEKKPVSYDKENFDYQVTTNFLFNEANIDGHKLDKYSQDISFQPKLDVVEKTYIKKSGSWVSVFDTGVISATNPSNNKESFHVEGIQVVSRGGLQQGTQQANYNVKKISLKTHKLDILSAPFSGEIKKTDHHVKNHSTATNIQVTNRDRKETVTFNLSESTNDLKINKKLDSGYILGEQNSLIKTITISKDNQKKASLNNITYQSNILENGTNTYDLSGLLSLDIKLEQFELFMKQLSEDLSPIGLGKGVDLSFEPTSFKLTNKITQLSESTLNKIISLSYLNISSNHSPDELKDDIVEIVQSLQSTDTALSTSLSLGTNKGNANIDLKIRLSEAGKKVTLEDLMALNTKRAKDFKHFLTYFNVDINLSIDQDVIKALAQTHSIATLSILGFTEYKDEKLLSKLLLKNGKITINGKELPRLPF